MQKAADDNGVILNIGVCNRFNTSVNKIAELIQAGVLGTCITCIARSARTAPSLAWAVHSPPRRAAAAAR